MAEVVIRGRNILLRHKRPEDAWDNYTWRVDEELARLDAATPLQISFQEYLRFYGDELHRPFPWSRRFAIDTLHGKHIGSCMCYDINMVDQEAEVGIMIGDRAYWNNGYGQDSLAALLDHVFATLHLRRVYLHTLEWNTRARRCFDKVGFQVVGRVHKAGRDFILMELWRRRWEGAKSDTETQTQVVEQSVHG